VTVSVVIPARNAETFIEATVRSALGQEGFGSGQLEIVVVDDGSEDGTSRVVRAVGSPQVRVIAGPRRGVSAARNAGVSATTGEHVAFLDHDDLWEPSKTARQVAILDADPRVGLVFTQARVEDAERGHRTLELIPRIDDPEALLARAYESLIHWNYIPMSSVIVRRSSLAALGPNGPFDSRWSLSEDWDLWLRLARRLGPGGVAYVAEPLTRYVVRSGRATERMADLRLEDIAILEEQLAANDWLVRDDPARVRERRYRLHEEAGYWLLREGRASEARRALRSAWRQKPSSLRTLARLVGSYAGLGVPAGAARD
jgi:glycosyltransferase involved in cell wall biosynthesis